AAAAAVASVAEAAGVAIAPPPLWRGEVTSRVSRFQKRHGLQRKLEFDAPAPPPVLPPPAGNVIPFPGPDTVSEPTPEALAPVELAPVELAPVSTVPAEPAPVASWGPPPPLPRVTPPAGSSALPQQQAISFPRLTPLDQPATLEFPVA